MHVGIGQQRLGQRDRPVGRHRDFIAVLARIARARDDAGRTDEGHVPHVHEGHRGHFGVELRQRGLRRRPLQGDEAPVAQFLDLAIGRKVLAQMGDVLRLAGGVHHQEEVIAAIGEHQVVEDAALGVGEEAVALAARLQPEHIDRHQPFERQRRVLDAARLRAQDHLAHVADVEETGLGAGVKMFLHHAFGELHRHRVAREFHHLAADPGVEGSERGLSKLGRVRHWRTP